MADKRTELALAILGYIEQNQGYGGVAFLGLVGESFTAVRMDKVYGEIRTDDDNDFIVWKWPKTPPGGWPDPDEEVSNDGE